MDVRDIEHLANKQKLLDQVAKNIGRNIQYKIETDRLEEMVSKTGSSPRKIEDVYLAYALPADATWGKLRVKFVDGHTVKVAYPGLQSKKFDYKDLDFQDTRTNNPDLKWKFLQILAENHGSLSPEKYDRRFHKNTKYEVAKRLKAFFAVSDDPFEKYSKQDGYRLRFTLLPESDTTPFEQDRSFFEDN